MGNISVVIPEAVSAIGKEIMVVSIMLASCKKESRRRKWIKTDGRRKYN
jgi:hypothetical protein